MKVSKRKAKRGRPRISQKRLGKHQQSLVNRLMRAIKGFKVHASDAKKRETDLNTRLIKKLKRVDCRIVNKGIASVRFVEETYRPECSLAGTGAHPLFAVECKKLHDKSAKRLFKEGMSQRFYISQNASA